MLKKIIKIGLIISALIIIGALLLDLYIVKTTKSKIYAKTSQIPNAYTGLILGSKVYNNGNPSGILKDRLDAGLELYKKNKIKRFLLSGDHGTKQYDEVNSMKKYLLKKGVSEKDIFLDHAGFDTYNSLFRAKEIFLVKDLIIVTQQFHLKRSLFIAKNIGLNAVGYVADKHQYSIANKMKIREKLANVKAFLELSINRKPTFLGHKIPITGDSSKSFD
jgi:SanA protein